MLDFANQEPINLRSNVKILESRIVGSGELVNEVHVHGCLGSTYEGVQHPSLGDGTVGCSYNCKGKRTTSPIEDIGR